MLVTERTAEPRVPGRVPCGPRAAAAPDRVLVVDPVGADGGAVWSRRPGVVDWVGGARGRSGEEQG